MARFSNAQVPEAVQSFWAALQAGEFIADAAVAAGTYRKQGTRWVAACGGVRPRRGRNLKGRCLSFAEREEIALGRARGESMRCIARRLGRSPSTVSRELRRNADRRGYRATTAHALAYERASRPKPAKLATNLALRAIVQDDLKRRYSPEQIAGRLRRRFPENPEMWVSTETIYQSLYVQSRGALKRELTRYLRTGRARQPLAQTRRHQQHLLAIALNEVLRHAWDRPARPGRPGSIRHPPRRLTAAPIGDGKHTGLPGTARLRSDGGQTAPPCAPARLVLPAPGGRDRHRRPRHRAIGEGRAPPARSGTGLARLARAPDHHPARLTETTAPAPPSPLPGDLCNSVPGRRRPPLRNENLDSGKRSPPQGVALPAEGAHSASTRDRRGTVVQAFSHAVAAIYRPASRRSISDGVGARVGVQATSRPRTPSSSSAGLRSARSRASPGVPSSFSDCVRRSGTSGPCGRCRRASGRRGSRTPPGRAVAWDAAYPGKCCLPNRGPLASTGTIRRGREPCVALSSRPSWWLFWQQEPRWRALARSVRRRRPRAWPG